MAETAKDRLLFVAGVCMKRRGWETQRDRKAIKSDLKPSVVEGSSGLLRAAIGVGESQTVSLEIDYA
jgi:hypothetical protein